MNTATQPILSYPDLLPFPASPGPPLPALVGPPSSPYPTRHFPALIGPPSTPHLPVHSIQCFSTLAACSLRLAAQQYWQQQVNYSIDVSLNDLEKSLDGFIKMQYHNNSPDTLTFIWITPVAQRF